MDMLEMVTIYRDCPHLDNLLYRVSAVAPKELGREEIVVEIRLVKFGAMTAWTMGQGHQSTVFQDKDDLMMPTYMYNNPMSNLALT
jgi:hypothetical protein